MSSRLEQRARRRRAILDAAWSLAERDGIAGLSLRDLAREVGVRAPSLYGYFDGKGAIYDEMFAQGWHEFDRVLADLPAGGDAAELLSSGTDAMLAFCAESLPRYQLMFTRVIPGWEPSAAAYEASVAAFERMVQALAAVGVTDPAHVDLWTAIGSGLAAQQAANDPGGDRYRRLVPAAAQMFLAHVRAEDRHEREALR